MAGKVFFSVSMSLDNDIARETFESTGASVMGKRMFEAGEQAWPEEAPFHTPVFVVRHEKRDPWERPGGTTFNFVNDGIEAALDQAREASGDRDVRIAGGGATILEYVNAGLIDEFSIALSPVLFGSGIGFAVHFFDQAMVNALAHDWNLAEVHPFEEGDLPRRLWRVTQSKRS